MWGKKKTTLSNKNGRQQEIRYPSGCPTSIDLCARFASDKDQWHAVDHQFGPRSCTRSAILLLALNQGQHTIALERAARGEARCSSPTQGGQTGDGDRSDRSPVKIGDDRQTLAWEGPRQSKHAQGCSRIGRPPRTPSGITETKEEQQIWGLEELGFEQDKK